MTGERRVIGLDVELEMLLESVRAQKCDPARDIEVVLMLRRLLGLRLDEKLDFEANRFRVVHGHVKKRAEMILLTLEVGVEQGLVAFAAAPENVVLTAKLLRDFECLLH